MRSRPTPAGARGLWWPFLPLVWTRSAAAPALSCAGRLVRSERRSYASRHRVGTLANASRRSGVEQVLSCKWLRSRLRAPRVGIPPAPKPDGRCVACAGDQLSYAPPGSRRRSSNVTILSDLCQQGGAHLGSLQLQQCSTQLVSIQQVSQPMGKHWNWQLWAAAGRGGTAASRRGWASGSTAAVAGVSMAGGASWRAGAAQALGAAGVLGPVSSAAGAAAASQPASASVVRARTAGCR
jgi:hypothetical protein